MDFVKTIEAIGQTVENFTDVQTKRVNELQDRIERVEATAERPKAGAANSESVEQTQYRGAFVDWLRRPHDDVTKGRLAQAIGDLGKKDITIGSAADGGYAVPLEISSRIEQRVRQLNPFRQLCRVDTISSSDFRALVSLEGSAGWVAESGTRSKTGAPYLRERVPTIGEVYAYPQASNWALEDIMFDVQSWIVNDASAEFASQEATAFLTGDGSAKPTGLLDATPSAFSDDHSPLRADGAIQYVPCDSVSPQSLKLDDVIDLVAQVKERYLAESDACAFVMSRLTLAHLRKLKDEQNQYLWQPSLQAGTPERLLGYPVFTCDALDGPTTGDGFPVLFGNFRRGYLIVDRGPFQITANPYSAIGHTSFYIRRRVGGCVLNNDAIKTLKLADS